MRPIFLIGFMGCGKSTLGRNLSKMTGLDFIDLDHYIEARYRKTVHEIFAERGERGFRELERRMLEEVSEFEDVVIACGGGTPCEPGNMELMNSRGLTVLLDTSRDKLMTRLKRGRHKRPLLADKDDAALEKTVDELMRLRRQYYEKASARFAGDLLENEVEIQETATRFIETFNLQTSQSSR